MSKTTFEWIFMTKDRKKFAEPPEKTNNLTKTRFLKDSLTNFFLPSEKFLHPIFV